jgi:hypothetical protein
MAAAFDKITGLPPKTPKSKKETSNSSTARRRVTVFELTHYS